MGDQLILLLMGGDQGESEFGVSGVGGMAVAAHCVAESELDVDAGADCNFSDFLISIKKFLQKIYTKKISTENFNEKFLNKRK